MLQALSLFRLLAILAGVQARARLGNASSASAAAVASDAVLLALAKTALGVISNSSGATPAAGPAAGPSPASASEGATSGGFHIDGLSPRVRDLRARLLRFMEAHVYPAEAAFEAHGSGADRWSIPPLMEQLKGKVSYSVYGLSIALLEDGRGCHFLKGRPL
jgi:acyl-CoA dehydrogenase